ncbi:MAG: Tox-REase-5 domain-containing protein [Thiolinea sp.]
MRPSAPTFVIGKSDGGPGTWKKAAIPAKGADYQQRVTGAPKGIEYFVNTSVIPGGVKKFDGYDPQRNVLIDAKDWSGWPPTNKTGKTHKWATDEIVKDARAQSDISKQIGIKVEWCVPTQEKANEIRDLLKDGKIEGIVIRVFP